MDRKKVLKRLMALDCAKGRLSHCTEPADAMQGIENMATSRAMACIADALYSELLMEHQKAYADAVDAVAKYETFNISRNDAHELVSNHLEQLIDLFMV